MERLFLVDQTLDRLGSSGFEYLCCLIDAAASEQSRSVAVGTERRFPWKQRQHGEATRDLFRSAKVLPSFRSVGSRRLSWFSGMQDSGEVISESGQNQVGRSKLAGLLRAYRGRTFRLQRRKQIARFACDCNRFFRSASTGEFRRGDHVFFADVTELELMGLAVFLANAPSSSLATWHLQFRHDFPEGDLGFDARGSLARKVRACFMASLARIPDHDLRFYGISAELVERYERLELTPFTVLPYPVSPDFRPAPAAKAAAAVFQHELAPRRSLVSLPYGNPGARGGEVVYPDGEQVSDSGNRSKSADRSLPSIPIRMVVPVSVDTEGELPLQRMVQGLWKDYFAEGRLQLAFSSAGGGNWWSPSSRNSLVSGRRLSGFPATGNESAIEHFQGPLPQARRRDLVRNSDFALMLPDRCHSSSARSLGELLSCGKPVLVPAGSFMASKLQPSLDRHIDSLRKRLSLSRSLDLSDLRFGSANVPLGGGVLSFDRGLHPFCAETEKDAAENVAVLRFRWHHPNRSQFMRVRCIEKRGNSERKLTTRVVPQRQAGRYSLSLFRLGLGGERIRFEFENAFNDSSAAIRDLSIELFSEADLDHVRLGGNGLIYADPMSVEEEITEVVENLDYYRHSAMSDSQEWWRSHDPQQTLEEMLGSKLLRNAA